MYFVSKVFENAKKLLHIVHILICRADFFEQYKKRPHDLFLHNSIKYFKGMVLSVILHFLVVPPDKQPVKAVVLVGLDHEEKE